VSVLDIRVKGSPSTVRSSLNLHSRKINSIHFQGDATSARDTFVTSSTDASVCIWDLRRMGGSGGAQAVKDYKAVATLQHGKACHGVISASTISIKTSCLGPHPNPPSGAMLHCCNTESVYLRGYFTAVGHPSLPCRRLFSSRRQE
jgi:WD40 repeat protein